MNTNTTDSVKAYYASSPDKEWLRLDAAREGFVEFAVTCRALAAHLPGQARVLDIGGGPGR